jgi:CheY-like chemotaxis protein
MIAMIRQTARGFRRLLQHTLTKMLIQPIVFNNKSNPKKVIYTWVPDNSVTRTTLEITDVSMTLNSEVYTPKALHVEDNAEIRAIVTYFLRKNCELEHAQSGERAIELARDNQFDVIIMDINLGDGIDGIETARQIKSLTGYERVPIIAITANTSSEIKENCLNVGMDAFLPKPFRKEDLVNTINYVLEKKTAIS